MRSGINTVAKIMDSAVKDLKNVVDVSISVILGSFFSLCFLEEGFRFYGLVLLYCLIVSFHYASEIMRDEPFLRRCLLTGLFLSYTAFCCVSTSWMVLLLLPYILSYSDAINMNRLRNRFAVIGISLFSLLAFNPPWQSDFRLIHYMFFSALLIINSMICFKLFKWVGKYEKTLKGYENAMSITAVNELTEKIFSSRIAIEKDVAVQNARFEERETICRNMHNAVGHTITSSILTLEAAYILHDVSPEESMKKIMTARDKVSQSLESIRQISRMLDPENETTALSDLIASLCLCAEQFKSPTSVSIRHNLKEQRIDAVIAKRHAEFLIGALMELLSNASRAYDVTMITVLFTHNKENVRLAVSDDGISFFSLSETQKEERLSSGYGLKKIEKYVRESGGGFSLKNDGGFTVDITIPIGGGCADE